jgi:hypothetical protein
MGRPLLKATAPLWPGLPNLALSLAFPRGRGIGGGSRQAPPKLGFGPAYIK